MDWELPFVHTEEDPSVSVPNVASSVHSDTEGMNEEEKRVRRLLRNRESARDSRRRKKQKVQLLESRVAELTEEVNRLRMAAEIAAPGFPDSTFTESTLYLCQKLADALANPLTPDQEIDSIVDEFQDIVGATGKSRVETLSKTFDQTMDMMIPMHVKFCLWVCGSDTSCSQPGPPKWEDLTLNTSLTAEQIGKFKEYQRVFGKEKVGLREAFQNLKKMMVRIVRHAKALNSILVELRPLMQPRQTGLFALWLHKYYIDLATEKVLSYGSNSTEVLKAE